MSIPAMARELVGQWEGSSLLWLSPEAPPRRCGTTASVSFVAQGRFVTVAYTWEYEGKPQEGLLLLGMDKQERALEAIWIDSWHMADKMLVCRGDADGSGEISVLGSYAAPPGPDWGWRIALRSGAAGEFQIRMYNISPGGEEEPAVEASYTRQS
jgi:hypothetical protein